MSSIYNLPPHLQQRVQAELKFGESLVWVGQPNPNRFMKTGFALWLFFIPWTAFSLFWMAGASGFHLPTFDSPFSFFPLFGLPFLLIGLGGLASPFWLRHKARSMIYAITTQRAFSIEGIKSITVKTYLAADIHNIERTEHADGTGDLVLRTESYQDNEGHKGTNKQGFFAVEEVKKVEHLLDNLTRTNLV
ncbi:MAG: hypothetical protein PHU06_13670 [Gallionella sp.]|nr:hypothetical protein [Gallionella sp.]MDD4960051.1 hypothetical protein [Gallionella sp.]